MKNDCDGSSLEKGDFLLRHNFREEEFSDSGLEWDVLTAIYRRHTEMAGELESAGSYVADRLRHVPDVHSTKLRIKDPEHLIKKIIRKRLRNPDVSIDVADYDAAVTDLIGIRALHLFKDDWRSIHEFVTSTWELHETPIAYVREGDHELDFKKAACEIRKHEFGYRSVHYVLKSRPAKQVRLVELQVRTLFEEGWSEIDHRVRYPNISDSPYLSGFLALFNRLAGSADEMGTYTKHLHSYLLDLSRCADAQKRQAEQKEAELSEAVSRLQISEREKTDLQKQIAELRASQSKLMPRISGSAIAASAIPNFEIPNFSKLLEQNVCAGCGSK